MNNTSPEIEAMIRELYEQRSPEERLRMVSGMFDDGVVLLKAGIMHRDPNLLESDPRREVFRSLYSDCFTADEMDRIQDYLNQGPA